jgi:hypothetical protein
MPSKSTEVLVTDSMGLSRLIGRMRATLRDKGQFRAIIRTTRKRSLEQSALYYAWIAQIHVERGEESVQEVRRFAKLNFFVPILVAENEEFAEAIAPVLAKMTEPEQLGLMDLIQATSICNTSQMSRGLESMANHYAGIDVDPVMLEFPEEAH